MPTTAVAPTNIAIIKYWGKNPKWERYHVPMKSSLSFTVGGLFTKTTVEAKPGSGKADFTLNGKRITDGMKEFKYIADFMEKIGAFYPFVKNYDYKIVSENNFPTSAGFASSASGFAALVKAMVGELDEFAFARDDDKLLSALARLGSGSATRSIPSEGGLVIWYRGISPDEPGPDGLSEKQIMEKVASSYAESLLPPSHWEELRIIYGKVAQKEKKVKSRAGMKTTVQTDPLYEAWVDYEEEKLLPEVIEEVKRKDFSSLAKHIMQASNNLHSACLRTYPPIHYLNDTSWAIVDALVEMNESEIKAAYTFDAGPNVVVFTLAEHEAEVVSLLKDIVGEENVFATKPGKGPYYVEDHLF